MQRSDGRGTGALEQECRILALAPGTLLVEAARRYYLPSDQGYERTIGERMAFRAAERDAARAAGRTPKDPTPGPQIQGMRVGDQVFKAREESRRKAAETESKDAAG